jgi:hypothetical protein
MRARHRFYDGGIETRRVVGQRDVQHRVGSALPVDPGDCG